MPGGSAEQIKLPRSFQQQMATSGENAVRIRMAWDEITVVDLLPNVTVPTLVLHSLHDGAAPFEEGRLVAKSIPNARFVNLESETTSRCLAKAGVAKIHRRDRGVSVGIASATSRELRHAHRLPAAPCFDARAGLAAAQKGPTGDNRKSQPLPAARGIGIAFIASCQRDVSKSRSLRGRAALVVAGRRSSTCSVN